MKIGHFLLAEELLPSQFMQCGSLNMGISIITLATTSTNDTGNSAVGCA
jgi:hypothetical protein